MAFIDTPLAYVDFFETIAENYVDIEHSEQTPRFVVIASAKEDPFRLFDLGEFLQGQRSKLKYAPENGNRKMLMLLQMMDTDFDELKKGNPKSAVNGAFILLSPLYSKSDWAARDAIYDMAYSAGKNIMAYLKEYFELNDGYGYLIGEACNCEPVGPIVPDALYGYRFNFSFKSFTPLCFNAVLFNNTVPPTL